MSSKEDAPDPGTSTADTNQATPAAPQDDNQENSGCPECQHISTECSSSCRHCFCPLCLWDWSLGEAVCPRCQRPTRHPYPQHVALYHEVQDRVYDSKRRRPWSWSQHLGRDGPWDRRGRRSVRWPRDGRCQSRHGWGGDSPRRRRYLRQQRRIWEDTPEEGRAPRLEWAIPASSQRRRSRRRSRRSWSQQEWAQGHRRWSRSGERSRGWDRQHSRSSRRDQDAQTDSHERSAGQRRRRSWNADDRHAPRPQHDVPSEWRGPLPWEEADSSRQWHTARRHDVTSERWGMLPWEEADSSRQWYTGRRHNVPSERRGMLPWEEAHSSRQWYTGRRHDVPSERRGMLPWEEADSSRQRHTRRRQSRGRSHRRRRNSQGMVPNDHSPNQRHWRGRNTDDRHSPRPQHDPSSRRSERHPWQEHARRSQRRSRSHRRGRNSRTASQGAVPPDHSRRQRQQESRNADQEQAPSFQQDLPGSSGRSRNRRRGSAGHRES